jgi:hypothetical protein
MDTSLVFTKPSQFRNEDVSFWGESSLGMASVAMSQPNVGAGYK